MLEHFKNKGVKIDFFDPFVDKVKIKGALFKSIRNMKYENLSRYSAVIICSNHDNFNYSKILRYSKKIFDTRGVFSNRKNVVNC